MWKNSSLLLFIGIAAAILSASLFHACAEHNLWREFWVSEFHIVLTATAAFVVLKTSAANKKKTR